jgi:hypothetical protein
MCGGLSSQIFIMVAILAGGQSLRHFFLSHEIMKVVGEMSTCRTFAKIHQKTFERLFIPGEVSLPPEVYRNESHMK